MLPKKVVITGIGLITPLGFNAEATWNALLKCESGIRKINRFDTTNFSSQIGGLVTKNKDYVAESYFEARDIKKMDLFIQYGLIATDEAIADSNIEINEKNSDRVGVIVGSGVGGLPIIEETSVKLSKSHNGKVNPYFIPATLINLLSGYITIRYKIHGPSQAVITACATSANAIVDSYRMIRYGEVDIMVAGGAESVMMPLGVAGFSSCKTLSTQYNNDPTLASRPWDQNRDGFVMSEGAGIVVLEEYEHAKNRGAKIYAEIVGYGVSSDAYHVTAPHPEGKGAYSAMDKALKNAELSPNQIDYINAHGTSTILGDEIELRVVQKLFKDSSKIKMSSTKSSTGHLLGAAGSVEIAFCAFAIKDQIAPATLNLDNPILEAAINLVPHIPQETKINYTMSNSFGFGGANVSIILKKI